MKARANWLAEAKPVATATSSTGSDVSRRSWRARSSPSARSRQDEVLVTTIDRSFKSSDRTYGARRVWHDVGVAPVSPDSRRLGLGTEAQELAW